jgi:hypothetical protein
MKPADITVEMVREAMRKSAKMADVRDPTVGARMQIDTIVLMIHGYDPDPNTPWDRRNAMRTAAVDALSWDGAKLTEPTSGQRTRVKQFLLHLVETGEVERIGDALTFAWITDEMKAARAYMAATKDRLNDVAAQLYELLGGDEAFKARKLSVSATIDRRDVTQGGITLVLDEERATRVLVALKALS